MNNMMGQIPLEKEFSGLSAIKSVYSRILHAFARYIPMFPRWRVALHRARGVKIGESVFIGSDVFIDNTYPDKIIIEDCVTVISNTFIIGHSFTPLHLRKILASENGEKEGVILRKGSYIGAKSIIMPGVEIGECSIIGSGSVVTNDIQPYSIAMGAPARVVRTFSEDDILWK